MATSDLIRNMTPEERRDLASRMYNPLRCGGMHYDDNGMPIYVIGGKPRTPQEHDDIIRKMNPRWNDAALRANGSLLCDEDGVCRKYAAPPRSR